MDYSRIVMIAPYKELAEQARKTTLELHKPYKVIHAEMSAGAQAAKDSVAQGAEVIISRGGTASLIRQAVDIPVVEIEVSGYDIVRTLYPLREKRGPFGIVGFANVIKGCKSVADVLGLEVTIYELEREEQKTINQVYTSKLLDTQAIIGDTVAVRYAEELNHPFWLITSGPESVSNALFQAERLLEALDYERAKTARSDAVLNSVHEGVITIDSEGNIVNINAQAKQLLKVSPDILGKTAKEVFDSELLEVVNSGRSSIGRLETIRGQHLVVNLHPISDRGLNLGGVITIQDTSHIQNVEHSIRRKLHNKGLLAKFTINDFIGKSQAVSALLEQAIKFSKTDSSVLILGESGTGKELLAQSVHNESLRKNGPFVAINCAALPEHLLESELFGYEEGAFTGARRGGKLGLLELAHGGTVFLDEIGELPLTVQARLLRVLQEKEVMRLGGDKVIPIDVRVISATHRPLRAAVQNGEFRSDLFYRLNVLTLIVPALRDRPGDVKLLMDHFLVWFSHKLNKPGICFQPEIYQVFEGYDWPGNVRELRNAVEKLVVLCESLTIEVDSLKSLSFVVREQNLSAKAQKDLVVPGDTPVVEVEGTLTEIEKRVIDKVLALENQNLTKAARRLGINRTTLWRKLQNTR